MINIHFDSDETSESVDRKVTFNVKSENSEGGFLCRVYETEHFDLVFGFKNNKLDAFLYGSKDFNVYKTVLTRLESKYTMKDYTKKTKKIFSDPDLEKSLFARIDTNTDITLSNRTHQWSFSLNKHKKLFGLF